MKNTTNVRSKKPTVAKDNGKGMGNKGTGVIHSARNAQNYGKVENLTNSRGKHAISMQTMSLNTEKIGISYSSGNISCGNETAQQISESSHNYENSDITKRNKDLSNISYRDNVQPTSSQSSDADSPHERSTMSMSASAELTFSQSNLNDNFKQDDNYHGTECSNVSTSSDTISKTSSDIPSIVSTLSFDPLEISRFPLQNVENITLNKIQEVKLVQKLLKEIKFVQSFDEDILRGQKRYWLYMHNISDEVLRTRIKTALETHCQAPMQWITSCEFEINIDPDCKIEKIRDYKNKV